MSKMKIATAAAPLLFAATMLTAGVLAATQANAADTRAHAQTDRPTHCATYLPGSAARSGKPAGDPNTGR
jgi:hypothetical protein